LPGHQLRQREGAGGAGAGLAEVAPARDDLLEAGAFRDAAGQEFAGAGDHGGQGPRPASGGDLLESRGEDLELDACNLSREAERLGLAEARSDAVFLQLYLFSGFPLPALVTLPEPFPACGFDVYLVGAPLHCGLPTGCSP
jgi:hypothetical protein